MERLRIPLEFSKSKSDDLELYATLQKYSNPAAYIKDVLKGLVPIPGAKQIDNRKEDNPKSMCDDEDLMDF